MTFSCKQINPNNMKKLFSVLLAATLCIGVGWAADETITFSAQGYTNGQEITTVNGTNFTITFNKGTNSNAPKYYDAGQAIRIYGGNSFTVSSTKTINKIELTFASGGDSNAITPDVNTYSNGTWTGNATSVKFTVGGTSGHRRLASVAVTYQAPAATVEAPVLTDEFTFWPVMNDEPSAQVTITPAAGNTVRYTTDGSAPSRTNGTAITAATTITIGATTTVKAISYVGTQTSGVVSKTYTLGPTVTGISAFKNVASGTTVRLYLPDNYNARTLYYNGSKKQAFVRDKTSAICIYNVTTNPTLKHGQHIAGWIIGTYTEYNGMPEFTASPATNSCYLVIADPVTESEVEPAEIDVDDYSGKIADWVTVKDLKMGESAIVPYNYYNLDGNSYYEEPYSGALYDITGIAYPYNDARQVAPIYENGFRPITYVVDALQNFVSPTAAISNAQVRLKRYLPSQGWSLLTVPFEVEGFEGDVLEYTGVTLGQVGAYEMNGNTYPIQGGVMHFEDYYGNLQPGIPYLVKPYYSQQEMTVSGVTLSGDAAGSVTFSLGAQNAPGVGLLANDTPAYVGDYTLVGTYSPATLPKDEATVKLIDNNTLSWTSLIDDTDIAGTEAYITIPDGAGVKLDLGGNEVVTAINDIHLDNNAPKDAVIYNILGIRLDRPLGELPPGVYIVNGKKIVKR